ncbi:DUF2608 domain-containing protein [Chlamydiifrater volucris]|uniref:DUF2608 domain-containing protein n=1 Tax=Chlamydiifrater volucris TaxID=2681470 RepID=UPI001BCFB2DE|nr:DUF2608 domain-containing protein [Chlamydiifrater volucris]
MSSSPKRSLFLAFTLSFLINIGFGNSSDGRFVYVKEIKGNHLISIKFLNEISEEVLFSDEKTLVIVGLDNTLFQGAEALSHKDWFTATIIGFTELGLSKEEAWHVVYPYWVEYQKKGSVKLIENVSKTMISRLLEQGKTVLAYTNKAMENRDLVKNQLDSVAVSFYPTPTAFIPEHDSSTSFTEKFLDKASLSTGLSFGVLFAANRTSSADFQKILLFLKEQLAKRPFEKIIFLNDDSQIATAFNQACKNLDIPSLSVTYTALRYQPKIYSPELSKIQHTFTEKLLSNDAAALLLRNNFTS